MIEPQQERAQLASLPPDQIPLAQVVQFVRKHLGLALVAGFGLAFIVAVVNLTLVARTYEASAILVIVPPSFASDLKPSTLTVQGYQKLLESDAVVSEAMHRLRARGILEQDEYLGIGEELETKIFVSRKEEEVTLAPMLQLVTRWSSREGAAEIANTWAQIFLERVGEVMGNTTSAAVEVIEREFPSSKRGLVALEKERISATNALQRNGDEVQEGWRKRLDEHELETARLVITHDKETADLLAASETETRGLLNAYRLETARLVKELELAKRIDAQRAQLAALDATAHALERERADLSWDLERKQTQLEQATLELSQTPQFVVRRKAPSEEAVWGAMVDGKARPSNLDALQKMTLATEDFNPVYTELLSRIANLRIEVNSLIPKNPQLEREIATKLTTVVDLRAALNADEQEIERIKGERENALALLQDQRAALFAKLKRDRETALSTLKQERGLEALVLEHHSKQELDALARERDAELERRSRDIEQLTDRFRALAKNYNQALLARAQPDTEDVRLGAPAVPPDRPRPRGTVAKSFLGFVLGAMLALAVAAMRQVNGRRRAGEASA